MLSMGVKTVTPRMNGPVYERTCKPTHKVFAIIVAMLDGGAGAAAIAFGSAG